MVIFVGKLKAFTVGMASDVQVMRRDYSVIMDFNIHILLNTFYSGRGYEENVSDKIFNVRMITKETRIERSIHLVFNQPPKQIRMNQTKAGNSLGRHATQGTLSKATHGKLLRVEVERIWDFLSA